MFSRGDLADVWDQPEPIRFTLPDGSRHEHTFDYHVTLADGLRYAVAITPIHHVEKYDFDLKLGYIRAALPDSFAEEVILMSEADFTRAQALNAQRYHEFTKKPDKDADDHIVRVAHEQREPTVLEELIAISGLGGRGFRAGFRAINVPPVILSQDAGQVKQPTLSERKITVESGAHKFGEGVLIGIIDVGGIAFAYEDFLDNDGLTRIERIWDMGGDYRQNPASHDYGAEFKREHLNAAITASKAIGVPPYAIEKQRQQIPGSHATHVASIAAGNRGISTDILKGHKRTKT